MALINISLDTESRQTALAVNGILVPVESFCMERWVDIEGDDQLSFAYTVVAENEQGLKETRRFYLPSPPVEASAEAEGETEETVKPDPETGLVNEVVEEAIQPDDEDIQKDLTSIFDRSEN